ncbi:MAG: hypothetical protein R2727_02430 [Bacteroidales bacterium]
MMKRRNLSSILIFLTFFLAGNLNGQYVVNSPDGNISVTVNTDEESPGQSHIWAGR